MQKKKGRWGEREGGGQRRGKGSQASVVGRVRAREGLGGGGGGGRGSVGFERARAKTGMNEGCLFFSLSPDQPLFAPRRSLSGWSEETPVPPPSGPRPRPAPPPRAAPLWSPPCPSERVMKGWKTRRRAHHRLPLARAAGAGLAARSRPSPCLKQRRPPARRPRHRMRNRSWLC